MREFLKNNKDTLNYYMLLLIVVSIFLLPNIKFPGLWFRIRPEDIFLPFVGFSLLINKTGKIRKHYFLFPLLYALVVIISIMINKRMLIVQDYFELYKIIKYSVFVLFFAALIPGQRIYHILRLVFAGLAVFNILHYFNIFGFNDYIMPAYCQGPHLETFGLNSLGEPATRRMLGTMGNPNVNAIVFLFFFIVFLVKEQKTTIDRLVLYTAFTFAMMCQSRTGFIALSFVYVTYLYVSRPKLATIIRQVSIFGALIFIVPLFVVYGISYLQSLANPSVVETVSVKGRLETWQHLWEMIVHKPFFGHGPFKEYFYINELYPESEYMLVIWRYGFIGFMVFIAMLFYPLFDILRYRMHYRLLKVVLLSLLFGITSITNNPFSEPRIMLLIAFSTALWLIGTSEDSALWQTKRKR